MKKLHVDVRGDKEKVFLSLQSLMAKLEKQKPIIKSENGFELQKSNQEVAAEKFNELFGKGENYQYAEFSENFSAAETLIFLENMIPLLDKNLKSYFSPLNLKLGILGEIKFDKNGIITHADCADAIGKNVLHFFLCHIQQDASGVLFRGKKLEYVFDVSVFEKTPKDAAGKNQFLGKDLVGFHGKSSNFGSMLGGLIQSLFESFSRGKLDLLTIDLLGNPHEISANKKIHRFERDFILPLRKNRKVVGLMAFANVFFQETTQTNSPYEGGNFLPEIRTQKDVLKIKKNK